MSAVYRSRTGHTLKWLLALLIFVLAMTITFDDVYGTPTVSQSHDGTETTDDPSGGIAAPAATKCPPSIVPEPTTLVLVAGGLSALYLVRRRRQLNK